LAFRVRIQNSVFRIRGLQLLTSVAARHSPLDPEKKDAKEVQTKYILSFRIEAKVSKQTSWLCYMCAGGYKEMSSILADQ
jgi:hypothetical protein